MMTNTELVTVLLKKTTRAKETTLSALSLGILEPETVLQIVSDLRLALSAAQELQNRALGNPPPKEG